MKRPSDSPASVVLDVLGTAVSVVGPAPMIARVRRQWSRCLTDAPPEREIELLTWLDPDAREYTLTYGLTLLGIQLVGGTRLNLHASGLSDDGGRVVALIAASGTGKTTAAKVLGRRFGYVTDECVSVERGGLAVRAYPKPLSVIVDGAATKSQHSPDDLGLDQAGTSLRLHRVVFLERSASTASATVSSIGLVDALERLVPQTSSTAAMPLPLADLAELLGRTGGAVVLRYREIEECDALLRELFAAPAEPHDPGRFEHVPGRRRGERDITVGGASFVATAFDDAVVSGAEALLLIGTALVRTSGLATAVWRRAADPAGAGASALEADPAGVREAVGQLEAAGLLCRVEDADRPE